MGFHVGRALGLMARAAPFLVFLVTVNFWVTAAIILATGTGMGMGWSVGALGDEGFQANITFYGGVLGFGLTVGVICFLHVYLLYLAKASHIAVTVELL